MLAIDHTEGLICSQSTLWYFMYAHLTSLTTLLATVLSIMSSCLSILWYAAEVPSSHSRELRLEMKKQVGVCLTVYILQWRITRKHSPRAFGVISCTKLSTLMLSRPRWDMVSVGRNRHYTFYSAVYAERVTSCADHNTCMCTNSSFLVCWLVTYAQLHALVIDLHLCRPLSAGLANHTLSVYYAVAPLVWEDWNESTWHIEQMFWNPRGQSIIPQPT